MDETKKKLTDDIFDLKLRKTKCKSAFTKTKNKLMNTIEEEMVNKDEIRELQDRLDSVQDDVSEVLQRLCIAYKDLGEQDNVEKTHLEMETIDSIYSNTHEMVYKKFQSIKSSSTSDITETVKETKLGNDMWRQMKRVSIPVFSGNKCKYPSWKAAFEACIDQAPATGEYKLLQLRQYLEGEALHAIEDLGHSAASYEAAKERLERKFGGSRRQIALYIEELSRFPPMKDENAKSIEKFADLLDIAVINMKEAEHEEDLGAGSLYHILQRKMPETMLTRYHRWIFESGEEENVETLKNWINQESSYYTIANETIHGLSQRNKNKHSFLANTSQKSSCKLCSDSHPIWECNQFKALSVPERWNEAKALKLCFRCLRTDHMGKNCPRAGQCKIDGCKKTHNRLLHDTFTSKLNENAQEFIPNVDTNLVQNVSQVFANSQKSETIALRTVPVIVSANGKKVKINALLDDGSTKTYINQDVASELGLKGQFEQVKVNTMNGRSEILNTMSVNFEIQGASNSSKRMSVEAFTTTKVTGNLVPIDWNKHADKWTHLQNIDFPFLASKRKIDLLIGLDYSDCHQSLKEIHGKVGEPIARLTPLGWTCVGALGSAENETYNSTMFTSSIQNTNMERTLRKFWEIEHFSECGATLSTNERKALNIVEKSIIEEDNFYKVPIPWKENKDTLCNNYQLALDRLKSTEKKLKKDPNVVDIYSKTIEQYQDKGYITKLPEKSVNEDCVWYMPHFPVVRLARETTKVRMVFDASAKYRDVSLNDVIHQGPKLQGDLFEILLRFRKNPVALACDVSEMYLQVGLLKEDQPFHRFLWRHQPSEDPQIYEFNRLVFGVNASPFLAQFVSQHNAKKYQDIYPLAAETVKKSTYMDDGLDSVETIEDAIDLYCQLKELWKKAGMHIRKWVSNSPEVLELIPIEDRSSQIDLTKGELPTLKTLGVLWIATEDSFSFSFHIPNITTNITKRNFLKVIATIFDPLGFLAPFIMIGKMLMQEIWISGLNWDDKISQEIACQIEQWYHDLQNLKEIKIPRCIKVQSNNNETDTSIHTFVDASSKAYGAVVYFKSTNQDDSSVRVIAAKGRVAPLQAISIPRLELLGAIIGLRLTQVVCKALDIPMENSTFWSDSMNVLFWIRNHSRHLKPFVANRIGEIQSQTTPAQWRYVPSENNPADIISRGMTAKELQSQESWWYGPKFLKEEENKWPENKVEKLLESQKEVKKSKQEDCLIIHGPVKDDTWRLNPERFSKWLRLVCVLAWVYRFLSNCKGEKLSGSLSNDEIRDSENKLICLAQHESYREELKMINRKASVSDNSKLIGLNPKIDQEGILRANTRLVNAEYLPYATKYPIILPNNSRITFLIVKHYHELRKHSGTNDVLAALSEKYWIIHAREEIRKVERACMECHRAKAKIAKQIMSPLPEIRLNMPLRAFAHTSVDYGGPFVTIQGRGKKREKRYLCLFTCLASRAVHLEMAYGLDTNSFLNAFFRFVNRRGVPVKMLSDRGTNFVGADKELKEIVKSIDTEQVTLKSAKQGISWQFNPPNAPHWGGVHEIMIKSAKRAIYSILKGADVNDEELLTAFCGAEALINSRPLTYQSAHPADSPPLTPNHFLFGQIGGQFAPEAIDSIAYNPTRRWRRVQELIRHFWQRWMREWLPSLSPRKKWFRESRDLEIGDVVLVIAQETQRGQWPLAIVTEIFKGKDGHVRAVKIRIGKTEYIRPVSKICPLEVVRNQDIQK